MKTVQQNYRIATSTMRTKTDRRDDKFSRLLSEAVDEGMSFLGNSAKEAIYIHLERSFHIKREDIPRKLDGFTAAIEAIFGEGAKLLEIKIIEELHKRMMTDFKYYPDMAEILFVDYIRVHETIYQT